MLSGLNDDSPASNDQVRESILCEQGRDYKTCRKSAALRSAVPAEPLYANA